MTSLFQGRRKQQRPVPIAVNDHDPWGMRDDSSSDDASVAGSSAPRTAAVRIMHHVRRFSSNTPKKRDRGPTEGGMYSTPVEQSSPSPSVYSFHDRPDTRPTIEQIAMGLHISRTPHILPPRATSLSPTHPHHPHAHRPHHHRASYSIDATARPGQPPLLTRPSPQTRRASMSAVVLPPPPARSSLKKPVRPPTAESATLAPSASDASLSTLATQTSSNTPATPRSLSHSLARSAPPASFPGKLRLEMLRLLPGKRGASSPGAPALPASGSDSDSMSGLSGVLPPARKSVRFSAGPSEAGSSPSEAP